MKDIEVNKMARRKSFAVIGVNNIGIYTTKSLLEKNQSVTLYDNDSEKLNKIIDDELNGAEGVIIDSTNKQALENNGLTQFDGVIVCFENSLETSVVTTLNLIELEIENIIVIAKNERHKKILLAIGCHWTRYRCSRNFNWSSGRNKIDFWYWIRSANQWWWVYFDKNYNYRTKYLWQNNWGKQSKSK
jgi:frataxin-like iron-binding protein CyaY